MKQASKLVIIVVAVVMSLMAEEVMKITLTGSVTDEALASISKIVFTDTTMVSIATYKLDDIEKIEFYDDQVSVKAKGSKFAEPSSLLKDGQIGFAVTSSKISLVLPKAATVTVSIYSLKGQIVAKLFSGNAKAGTMDLGLSNKSLASGVYSLMVKADNAIFVRKLIIN